MLAAMNDRSFVVTIAYIKTEPVQVALFGLIFLGDQVTPPMAVAILIATAGVDRDVAQAAAPARAAPRARRCSGLLSGAHVRAVGDRLSRRDPVARHLPNFVLAATFTLAVGLVMQAALLSLYLALRDPRGAARHRARLAAVAVRRLHGRASPRSSGSSPLRSPRAANVRTLALVEVLFAQAISRFVFKQPTTRARRRRHRADRGRRRRC